MIKPKININFIGIGAARAATTWITDCLKEHPEICISKNKEFDLFDSKGLLKNEREIKRQFSYCSGKKIKGIYPPFYLAFDKKIPLSIKKYFPDVKIIVCFRNPVERAYSHYLLEKSKGKNISFEKAVKEMPKIVNYGMYYKNLKRYIDLFPINNFLFLIYEDIGKDPIAFIQKIYRFLEVKDNFVPKNAYKRINPNIRDRRKFALIEKIDTSKMKKNFWTRSLINILKKINIDNTTLHKIKKWNIKNRHKIKPEEYKKPPIKKETEEYLHNTYKKDIEKLEKTIRKNLDQWKK